MHITRVSDIIIIRNCNADSEAPWSSIYQQLDAKLTVLKQSQKKSTIH